MDARRLRLLADSMGVADEVTVDLSGRLAEEFWHKVASTPEDKPEELTHPWGPV
jgi:hypothetical protein